MRHEIITPHEPTLDSSIQFRSLDEALEKVFNAMPEEKETSFLGRMMLDLVLGENDRG